MKETAEHARAINSLLLEQKGVPGVRIGNVQKGGHPECPSSALQMASL